MTNAKILLLSDEVVPQFYQDYHPGVFDDIDLIIACGDLPARYLEFIATVFRGYVLYVPGNHDDGYLEHPPLGCISIDDQLFVWKGLRIVGLGGSMRYKQGPFQYTDKEMDKRIRKLKSRIHKQGGVDILVTHAPAYHHYDGSDRCHTGFESFLTFLDKYKPAYFFHGHIHLNYGNYPRYSQIGSTQVINSFEKAIVEVELPQ